MWIDDQILKNCSRDVETQVFIPKETLLVLGNGNDAEKEAHLERCKQDGVSVLKRYGGGGAVVLHTGCLVVSAGLWVKDYFRNDFYFCQLNKALIAALASFHPSLSFVYQDGISDLCYEGKKIAGTSLFRSRNYLLYQASILYNSKIELIERYLKHPTKEPEYRQKKSHRDFIKGLFEILQGGSLEELRDSTAKYFPQNIHEKLSDELIQSQENQRKHLFGKSGVFT